MSEQTRGQTQERTLMKKFGIPMIAGAVAGFIASFAIVTVMNRGAFGDLDASREVAMLVAVLYVITGASVLIGAFSPALGSRFLNVEDADELREQKTMLTYSAIGMFALAGALALAALAAPVGPVPATIAVTGFAMMLLLTWFTGKRQEQHMDELMKAVSRDTAATAFYLVFLIGGTWALLGHVGWTAAPKPLDWLTMFVVLMLVASFWAAGKRGMLNRR